MQPAHSELFLHRFGAHSCSVTLCSDSFGHRMAFLHPPALIEVPPMRLLLKMCPNSAKCWKCSFVHTAATPARSLSRVLSGERSGVDGFVLFKSN